MDQRSDSQQSAVDGQEAARERAAARRRHRVSGFTLMEILIVMAMIGVISAYAYPKMISIFASANARSGRDRLQSYLNAARAVAVQKGRTTVFHASGQTVWVTADSAGLQTTYLQQVPLNTVYGVTLYASTDSVVFSGHGIAVGLNSSQSFTVTKSGKTQQVCIGILGALLVGGCP